MTKDKDFKALVRARKDATGENFTTARAMLLKERPPETTTQQVSKRGAGSLPPLIHEIDGALRARDALKEWMQSEHAKQRQLVENFAAPAAVSLKLVAEALNSRARELRFDSPVTVESSYDFDSPKTVSATLRLLMTQSRRDRDDQEMYSSRHGASVAYSWELHVFVSIDDPRQATQPSFAIEACRDGQDAWRCDIPTAECNPAGLSLDSSGDDVVQRFMAWFVRYVP